MIAGDVGPAGAMLDVPAPAKVNLFLHVVGRRADGYHLIESLFALVDLADRVRLTLREDGAILRETGPVEVPAQDDLCVRAACALQAETATRFGVSIALTKRIPMGAGLGGGSSDAASVLLALNRLWRTGLARADLARIGLKIGADVPFFIHGEHACVRGIGERIAPVSLPRCWVALARPPVAVSTAAIFASDDLTRSTPSAKMEVFSEGYGGNDLEAVAAARFAEVAATLAAVRKLAPHARMTGSGSCVIAAVATFAQAVQAVSALPPGVTGQVLRMLGRHPLAGPQWARQS